MFEEADNFADIFRGGLPYYLLLTLPILIICTSSPVLASSEFTVQRMSQFDVNGVSFGCRASALSLEAKSLYTWSTGRHCVVAKLQDITIEQFREIRQKAGGLVILLPKHIALMKVEEKEHLNLLEQAMLAQTSSIPVYFSPYNPELEKVIADITQTSDDVVKRIDESPNSAQSFGFSEFFHSISANGYQIIVSGASHVANKNTKIPIIQGELSPLKHNKQLDNGIDVNSKLPLIIVAAHLNTFGLYNEYPLNADAAVLMTIAELFSKLHITTNTTPKYRLLFLLSESGSLLNFQGAKKWLDENVQLQNVDFVLCLDTVIKALNAEPSTPLPLYMHVSKPPKEGSTMNNFYKLLKAVSTQHNNITVEGVHKKINLADTQLAWEHERFSMKRLPAFTLSALKTPKDPVRSTVFRDDETELLTSTLQSTKVIAEALARYVYGLYEEQEVEIFANSLALNQNVIKAYLNVKSSLHNNDLKNAFEKHLKNVKLIYDKPDVRDPDFMLYEGQEANLNVYRVKPAVFDLFLTVLIAAYLGSIYLFIQYFPELYTLLCKTRAATTSNGNHYERPYKAMKNN